MSEPDDDPVTLAQVIDFEQARARQQEAARLAQPDEENAVEPRDPERAQAAAERRRQRERTAQKRRRLEERTAQKRAAATKQRIQLRVADRLARIEAEVEAEIARLRLAYAHRQRREGGGLWMWPTMAASLVVLVAGLAYFAGTQKTSAAPAAVVPQRVAAKQLTKQPIRSGGPTGGTSRRLPRAPCGPSSGGSPSGTPYSPASPTSGPGCGRTPQGSMSVVHGAAGGIP